jgi:hypothetical protein
MSDVNTSATQGGQGSGTSAALRRAFDAWFAEKLADGSVQQQLSGSKAQPDPDAVTPCTLGTTAASLWLGERLPDRLSADMVRGSQWLVPFPDFLAPRVLNPSLANIAQRGAIDRDKDLCDQQRQLLVIAKSVLAIFEGTEAGTINQATILNLAADAIASCRSFVNKLDQERRESLVARLPACPEPLRKSAAHWVPDPVANHLFRNDFFDQYMVAVTATAALSAARAPAPKPVHITRPEPLSPTTLPATRPVPMPKAASNPKNRHRRTGQ